MDGSAYLRSCARDAVAVRAALEADPGAAVPTCPGWDLEKLALHLGLVFTWVAAQIEAGAAIEPAATRNEVVPAGPARVAWFGSVTDRLVGLLAGHDGGDSAGAWRGRPADVAFWRRRMAHEVAVHRYDADRARGIAPSLEADLSADGVTEVLELLLPYAPARAERWPPRGPLQMCQSDGPHGWEVRGGPGEATSWTVVEAPGSLPPAPQSTLGGAPALAWVRAPAADLLLVCWGRVGEVPGESGGDPVTLAEWTAAMHW